MTNTTRLRVAGGILLAAFASTMLAQTASPSPGTATTPATTAPAASQVQGAPASSETAASTQAAVQMEKFNVSDVPLEQQILPTSRPFTSVFGTEDNILDVPRNVTIISREQMDVIDIQDVTEFSKLTSSSYTTSNFGSPSNPNIRGQS